MMYRVSYMKIIILDRDQRGQGFDDGMLPPNNQISFQ